MKEPSAEDVIKGMPHPHQARARRLYDRGRRDGALGAAVQLQKLLDEHPDVPVLKTLEIWVKGMQEGE